MMHGTGIADVCTVTILHTTTVLTYAHYKSISGSSVLYTDQDSRCQKNVLETIYWSLCGYMCLSFVVMMLGRYVSRMGFDVLPCCIPTLACVGVAPADDNGLALEVIWPLETDVSGTL